MNTSEPQLAERTAARQIAGNRCQICGQNITLSSEGKFCTHCQTVVHLACESRGTCQVCGQSYRFYERPEFDPLSEAVVPRALRPAKGGAMALAVFMTVLLALVMMIIRQIAAHPQ